MRACGAGSGVVCKKKHYYITILDTQVGVGGRGRREKAWQTKEDVCECLKTKCVRRERVGKKGVVDRRGRGWRAREWEYIYKVSLEGTAGRGRMYKETEE